MHKFDSWEHKGLFSRERKCLVCGLVEFSMLGDGGSHWFGWEKITPSPWPRVLPKECNKPK